MKSIRRIKHKEPPSLFLAIFGDTPTLRVLDFLIVHRRFDYCMKDIAKYSRVGYATLKLFWNDLKKNNIVRYTRNVGKAQMFTLNTEDVKVEELIKLYRTTLQEKTEKEILTKEALVHA